MRQRHAPDSCGIFRADLAVRDRRRQIRDSGNPPLRRRCAALWLSDRQFADSFALAQLTPGPNLIIVTLIGYRVGGVAAAIVVTLAMCAPPCVIAYLVGRTAERFKGAAWHGAISRGLIGWPGSSRSPPP